MSTATLTMAIPRTRIPAGRILGGLGVAFMILDASMKLIPVQPVIDSFRQLGYSPALAPVIGLTALACVTLYLVPRTSVLGAVLLTGYLGGAVATHVRVGSPLFTHTLFPVYIATLFWAGLMLRDPHLRTVLFKRS